MWHGNPTKTFGCTLIEGSQAHPIITLSRTNPIIGTFAILGSQSFGKLGTAQTDIPKLGLIFTFPHKDDITVNDVHGYGYRSRGLGLWKNPVTLGMGTGHTTVVWQWPCDLNSAMTVMHYHCSTTSE